jgi:hypothetical protein
MRRIIIYGGLVLAGAAVLGVTAWITRSLNAAGESVLSVGAVVEHPSPGRIAEEVPAKFKQALAKRNHYDHIREIALPDLVRKTAAGGRFFIQLSPKWCCACWGMKNFVEDAYKVREGPEWLTIDPDKAGKEEIQVYLSSIGEKERPKGYPTAYLVASGKMERKLYGFNSAAIGRVLEEEAARN